MRRVTIKYNKLQKIFKVDEMSDWDKVVNFLLTKIESGMVIALYGDLGAGKTTLTQFIAKQLGVKKRALSPTFALIRSYNVTRLGSRTSDVGRLVHVDAYRIEDERELLALELDEELLESGTLMIIEWSEKIPKWLKKQSKVISVKIEQID
ncbi:tRNA (adenosine(37)-N6)-threonylcarbamoyltransferase complex ATPase subunit type 1 TsaE [Patescibacteria group bacterium]|nr:tRNA (adenosine(37)-N6)-threonylcarbamoyltransferase complex ATPase subunit type 1 TsaE [Patescibacteria group bacterium]